MERAYALFSGSNRSRRRESTISGSLGLGTSDVDIFKWENILSNPTFLLQLWNAASMGDGFYTAVAIDAVHEISTRELHVFSQWNPKRPMDTTNPSAFISVDFHFYELYTHCISCKENQNAKISQKGALQSKPRPPYSANQPWVIHRISIKLTCLLHVIPLSLRVDNELASYMAVCLLFITPYHNTIRKQQQQQVVGNVHTHISSWQQFYPITAQRFSPHIV